MTGSPAGRTGTVESLRHIGRYEIHGMLGRGAMGIVYRGRDPLLARDVAVKAMGTSLLEDAALRARFEREARAIAGLAHPNVVAIYDFGYQDGEPYIVMELLRGRDLGAALLARQPSSLEQRLGVLRQVLSGLSHAHRAGIVHRDVKPANIFLAEDGRVRLLDFGMARLVAAATGTNAVMGTANYMSPEQLEGRPVDGRSDLFSTGCVLFELLSGSPPFHAESLVAIAYRIVHHEPDYDLLPEGGEYAALRPVLVRALMKDAEQRYASADEFARDLEEHARLAVGPGHAERPRPDEPMPSAVPAPRPTPPRPEPQPADQATIDLRDALETTVPQPAAGATAPARPAGRPRLPPGVRWRVAASLVASIAVLVAVFAVFRDRAPLDPTPAPSPTPTAVPAVTPTPVARPRTSPPSTPSPRLPAPPRTTEPAVTPGPVESRPVESRPVESRPAEAPVTSLPTPMPSPVETPGLVVARWRGYITDERCKEKGAVDDHWDCVQACMRQGFRPLLAVEDKLYRLVGVERIRGNRNRPVVVEGTLDPATNTITVAETAAGQR